MSIPIERVLAQLSKTFTVRDIMIDSDDLVRADNQSDAQQILASHPEFDIIPLPSTGPLMTYFRRDRSKINPIRFEDLISDGTSLVDLPDIMSERDFFFVLSSNVISGFIHFSDLNKGLMKLPLFVLFEAVERHIWPEVAAKLNNSDLPKVLDEKRVEVLRHHIDRTRKKDVDVGWTGLLSFDEILRFAKFYSLVDLSNNDRALLANIRNRVAHTDRLLVAQRQDTQKLIRARNLCLQLLEK